MAWVFLICAIGFEVIGTTAMKLSDGLTRLGPTLVLFAAYVAAFGCLALCLKRIEVGTAYAIWSGVGTAAITMIGILFFRESFDLLKLAGTGLIIAGVVVLKM